MFFKVIREAFFILLVIYLTTTLFNNWSHYSACFAPTHTFLLTTYAFILVSRAIRLFPRKNQALFLHKVFYPILGVIILQGTAYQMVNSIYTPTCTVKLGQGHVLSAIILLLIANSGTMVTALGDIMLVWLYKIFEMRIDNFIREVNTIMVPQEIALSNGFRGEAKGYIYRGLSIDEIAKIQHMMVMKQDKITEEMCSVCYEDFKQGDDMCVLPVCHHIFHMNCVKEWLVKSPVCPMCRANVRLNLETEEFDVPKEICQV